MSNDSEYISPEGVIFFNKYKDQWLSERVMILYDLKLITTDGLSKLKLELSNENEFNKMAAIYLNTCNDVYNDKLEKIDKKYEELYMSSN